MLAVNVSPVQFRKAEDLVGTAALALARSGLEPQRLEIEITESVLLAGNSANVAVLEQLRARGIRIALDDFGIGYSSLSYLRQFPFSRLKIDRSFVREINSSTESLAIVRAIIGLATSLGIDTPRASKRSRSSIRCVPNAVASCRASYSVRRSQPKTSQGSSARFSSMGWCVQPDQHFKALKVGKSEGL